MVEQGRYDESGVIIDANEGIQIYGGAGTMALTTRTTKDGDIQCYVGTDGKLYAGGGSVILDSTGLHIIGDSEFLLFENPAGTIKGAIYQHADGITLNAKGLYVRSHGDLVPGAYDNVFDLGKPALRWKAVHAVDLYGTAHYADVYFQDLECPICKQRFKVGDKLVFTILSVSDKEIRCLPAHMECAC